jgi:hypothetical protein
MRIIARSKIKVKRFSEVDFTSSCISILNHHVCAFGVGWLNE